MRICLLTLAACALCPALVDAGAGSAAGKVVLDLWDAAYLQGGKAGHVHTFVVQFEHEGRKLYRTTQELNLTAKRFKDTIQLRMDSGMTETEDGKVIAVFMRQYLGKNKQLDLTGTVVGNELRLVLDGGKPLKPAPWDDSVVGMYRQQRLLKEKNVKPGDAFTYQSFEPTINLAIKTFVTVKEPEEVELFGGRAKKRLLRVETRPEKIENVQLPTLITWVNDDLVPERSQVEAPGLGQIILYRATKAAALAPGPIATLTDIGINHYVKLAKRIPQPHDTASAVYRITIEGDDDPGSAFSRDGRQQVKNLKGNTFELHVRGRPEKSEEEKPGAEFTQSSYFITSADAKVMELARRAVGPEEDPWKKAVRIEKWVHDRMTVKAHEALATADHVARTLEGDCTEFAMLTAAMCRAEGVPSRTAVGLVYGDVRSGPVFAFHMWTEVYVNGRWLPLDATLGKGGIGAAHLKITDSAWHDTRTLTPLFPVVRVVGRVAIEVVSTNGRP